MSDGWARISVRTDGGMILGREFGLLEPGAIYEIRELLGMLVLMNIGTADPAVWNRDIGAVAEDGLHLYTEDERADRAALRTARIKDGER